MTKQTKKPYNPWDHALTLPANTPNKNKVWGYDQKPLKGHTTRF